MSQRCHEYCSICAKTRAFLRSGHTQKDLSQEAFKSGFHSPNNKDNMFAIVGQKLEETENIYETIESYTCEIEKELLQTFGEMELDSKNRAHPIRKGSKCPKPIVIYEESIPESQIHDDPYVLAYKADDADNTYETIGTTFSSEMDSVPSLPPRGNRPINMNCEFNHRCSVKCGNNNMHRGSSTSTLDIHNIRGHQLKLREDNIEFGAQPVTCKGCYQTRMESVARKVSLLKGRGQLKLSVYVNCGLLTIHVVQARHLGSKSTPNCNTYVKLSLAPDDMRRTKCKTGLAYESNSPLYDEKFSFELLDEDLKKRLLISVWNRDGSKSKSEFLGCMSFGVHHIQSSRRVVNGWYYLLTEEVGRRKHLRVMDRRSMGTLSERPAKNLTPVRDDLHWMDPHIVVVRRTGTGFGFTVTGSAPVRVCKVESGSPADAAGLRKDDCIVRINGQNVSRSTSDAIARLVRHSQKQIVIEIQRARALDTLISSPWKPTLCSTFLPSSSGSEEEEEDEDTGITSPRDSLRSSSPPPLRLEDLEENVRPSRCLMGSGGSTGSARSSGSGRYYRESLV